ncbi:hypothetical protein BB8028_0001g03170 [Beauveria bassiana]|uniref:Uncharacterized protein n=1 Tax=Beauveria bassiana TaxID=176275 RepID=A0A2S7XWW5_BEABA|nr:hypothetical protein BB8028_0001g03170 [Beauveria bassiana]
MAPPFANRPNREADSGLPLNWYQSVLDWASPDEERDNPGKFDVSGKPLASFHDLRTREFNKESGDWTFAHAVHVARWEFHQAGYTSTQLQESKQVPMRNDLLTSVLTALRSIYFPNILECTTFAQASAKFISDLDAMARIVVESLPNGKSQTEKVSRRHGLLTPLAKKWFLAAKFSSPTGVLPERLLKNLKTLGCSDYLNIEASSMTQTLRALRLSTDLAITKKKNNSSLNKCKASRKVDDDAERQAEKDATRPFDASPSKTMSFDRSSLQLLINKTIDDRLHEFNTSEVGKKRKFNDGHLDEPIEAAVKKKLASYEVLLDDYTGLTDHLVHSLVSFSDLSEKATKLKQRREELKAAATL